MMPLVYGEFLRFMKVLILQCLLQTFTIAGPVTTPVVGTTPPTTLGEFFVINIYSNYFCSQKWLLVNISFDGVPMKLSLFR